MAMSTMQTANRLLRCLRSETGKAYGAWQMLPGTNVSRQIARSGYDWVLVDTEHGNIDGALDAGAHGILVPLLYTADDARKLVQTAKFPPWGIRGFGSPFAMGTFNNETASEYLQQANDALVTIVQIETKEALENVEEIAQVEGIDVLLVGPFDLGNNIGHPYIGEMHPELRKAIETTLKAAVKAGKRAGIYCTGGQQAKDYADLGFHMLSVASDMIALPTYLRDALSVAKGAETETPQVTGPYGR